MRHLGLMSESQPSARYRAVIWVESSLVVFFGAPAAVWIAEHSRPLGLLLIAALAVTGLAFQYCGFVRVRAGHVEVVRPGMRKSLPRDQLREVRRYETMVVLDFADDTSVSLRLPFWMPGRRSMQDRLCADLDALLKGPGSAIPGAGQ